jgi:hypothetical protein
VKGWDAVDTVDRMAEAPEDEAPARNVNWRAVQFALAAAAAVPLLFIGGIDGWPWDNDKEPMAAPITVGIADPIRMEMSRLGVDALVDPLAADGAAGGLAAPLHGRVGWFEDGPEPGEMGRAVILGHSSDGKGGKDVFANLGKAKVGDQIEITTADQRTMIFRVAGVDTYKAADLPTDEVYGGDRESSELRLIAPSGKPDAKGEYPDKVVVSADLVS